MLYIAQEETFLYYQWDDETDMKELEEKVRSVKTDGLLWGASKLVEVSQDIITSLTNAIGEFFV